MTDLTQYGGGVEDGEPEDTGPSPRDETVRERRHQYETQAGRCRGISLSKGQRCGGAGLVDSNHQLCWHHEQHVDTPREDRPVTIYSPTKQLAKWCGVRAVMWDQLPYQVRDALHALDENGGEDV